jgi:hypothetical protein
MSLPWRPARLLRGTITDAITPLSYTVNPGDIAVITGWAGVVTGDGGGGGAFYELDINAGLAGTTSIAYLGLGFDGVVNLPETFGLFIPVFPGEILEANIFMGAGPGSIDLVVYGRMYAATQLGR